MKESDGHLLLDVCALQSGAELLKSDALIAVFIGLHDSAIGDIRQLFGRDIGAHHHM